LLEDFLTWGCIYSYTIASILLLSGFVFNKEKPLKIASYLVVPAFVAHTVIFVMRWAATGYFPANSEFENAITGGWFAIGFTVYLIFRGTDRRRTLYGSCNAPLSGLWGYEGP
jgi:ABC-type transport system involved in cytochrome c biogenesis permease subunit